MDATATVTTSPAKERGIGPEKLTVRIFRDVALKHLAETGRTKAALDEFLRRVLSHDGASKTDKTYARTLFRDVSGGDLPDWAKNLKEPAPEVMTDQDITDFLDAASESTSAPLQPAPAVEDVGLDFLEGMIEKTPEDPFLRDGGPLKEALAEFLQSNEHPFLRVFTVDNQRYVAVGTTMGRAKDSHGVEKAINIHFTVAPYHRFRDVPESVAVYQGGRQMSARETDARGLRKYVFCIKHQPGLKLRFWMRVGDKDIPGGARFVILTDDRVGYKRVDRGSF